MTTITNTDALDLALSHLTPRAEGGAGLALVPLRRGTKQPYDPRTPAERAEDAAAGWNPTWQGTTTSPLRWEAYWHRAQAEDSTHAETISLLRYRDGDDAAADPAEITAALAELTATAPAVGSAAHARVTALQRAVQRVPLTAAERDHLAQLTTQAETAMPPLNVAVDVGLSHVIVADADTPAEVAALRSWAAQTSGDDSWLSTPLTTSSPGVYDPAAGEWRHRDGGHLYFLLPDDYDVPDTLPGSLDVRRDDGSHFSLFLRDRYVLVPPSARPEGEYQFTGPAHPAPRWLLAWLDAKALATAQAKASASAYRQREGDGDAGLSDELREQVEAWYAATPWSMLLGQVGWTETGVDSSCGCPTWGRPGGASPKSATAHEPGCSRHSDSIDPPVHFWTTEPGPEIEDKIAETATGSRSLSKLQLAAALFCDGSDSVALEQIVGEPLSAPPMVQTFIEVASGFTVAGPRRPAAEGESAGVVVVSAEEWARMNAGATATANAPAVAPAPALAPAAALAPAVAQAPAPAIAPAETNTNAPSDALATSEATCTLAIDIETFSATDLASCGVYRYAEDPDFSVLLFAYAWGDNPVEVVDLTAGPLPDDLLAAILEPTVTKTAFNANFERVCLSRYLRDLGKLPEGEFLDPAAWRCTQVHAAVAGLPRRLDKVADALGVVEKMEEGKGLIRRFSAPNKPRKKDDLTHAVDLGDGRVRWLPASDPEGWETFKEYCRRDVEVEVAIRQALADVPVTDQVWAEYTADQHVNDRGIGIDMAVVEAAEPVIDRHRAEAEAEFAELTGGILANAPAQLRAWLAEHGYEVENTQKDTLGQLRDRAETDGNAAVARALELRPSLTSKSDSKYSAMRRYTCADGRARGTLAFHQAHTGRWGGRGVQPQNMAKTSDAVEAEHAALLRGEADLGMVARLTRTALVPSAGCVFVAADYAQIEPRLLAYLTGEPAPLRAFQQGEDVYCVAAEGMYGLPVEKNGRNADLRFYGKVATIACGYQMGSARLAAQNPDVSEADARDIVSRWRAANPRIVNFWREIEAAVRAAVNGAAAQHTAGLSIRTEPSPGREPGRDLVIGLPSGRALRYRHATLEPHPQRAGETAVFFTSADGRRTSTYGGKLTENVVQALGRDLLADAIVRAEAEGIQVAFSVHDEIIAESLDGQAEAVGDRLSEIMQTPPAWLGEGLPLVAEAEVYPYYRKS